mmetsp:Transcript_89588/g.252530  ORF Transcript_89588/g.252530 Transcript_89588/m.252530 type:complete len:254 (-) Transcript_89588:53-814(-)
MVPHYELVGVALCTIATCIKDHRHRVVRIHSGANRVEIKLADRDTHTPSSEIAEAENAAAVRKHDAIALVISVIVPAKFHLRVLLQHLFHIPAVCDGHVTSTAEERQLAKLLAGLPYCRCVHHWQEHRGPRYQRGVIQVRAPIVKRAHVGVGPQVVTERHYRPHLTKRLGDAVRLAHAEERRVQLRHLSALRVPLLYAPRRGDRLWERKRTAKNFVFAPESLINLILPIFSRCRKRHARVLEGWTHRCQGQGR